MYGGPIPSSGWVGVGDESSLPAAAAAQFSSTSSSTSTLPLPPMSPLHRLVFAFNHGRISKFNRIAIWMALFHLILRLLICRRIPFLSAHIRTAPPTLRNISMRRRPSGFVALLFIFFFILRFYFHLMSATVFDPFISVQSPSPFGPFPPETSPHLDGRRTAILWDDSSHRR